MNAKQRVVRWAGILVVLLCALVPPWRLTHTVAQTGAKESSSAGYHPIWSPPSTEIEVEEEQTDLRYQVDVLQLGIQLAVILVLINLGVFVLKDRPKPTKEEIANPG